MMGAALARIIAAKEPKRVTVKEMLRWAYGRQQVDILTGKTLERAEEREWHGSSADGVVQLMKIKELGYRIGGGGGSWGGSSDVHPDAERLHDVVLGLGSVNARLVVDYGHTGQHPEPMVATPQPSPPLQCVETRLNGSQTIGDRVGRGVFQGEERLYRISVAEVIAEIEPVYRMRGRKRVLARNEVVRREDVEYCPIEWWPDPAYVEAVNGIAEHWSKVMDVLRAKLADVTFQAHEILDLVVAQAAPHKSA